MNRIIERLLQLPNKSFLLLGPRGTGKSTLLKMQINAKVEINLLKSSQYLTLQQNPSALQELVGHLKSGDWVIVDEIQKIPALMDEIHLLYEEKKLNFAITGSSARKLKRGGANLLAGRALQAYLFPLVFKELDRLITIQNYMEWGGLPGVVTDQKNRQETLTTYVETYLKQELIEEGLIRRLEPFVRFLKIAGLYNAQILNVENIAREAQLKRTSVDTYFEILEDTLIGSRLPAVQLGLHSKELKHPKFYFFDPGVARASAGLAFEEIDSVWKGFAFETIIYHELQTYCSYKKRPKNLFYYKVNGGVEIDFLVEFEKKTLSRPRSFIAVEVKLSPKWDKSWSKKLNELLVVKKSRIQRAFGVYTGDKTLTHGQVTVLPVQDFLSSLWNGKLF